MKKTGFTFVITALLLSLAACGTVPPAESSTPAAEAVEGFGRRFDDMLHTLSVIEKWGRRKI